MLDSKEFDDIEDDNENKCEFCGESCTYEQELCHKCFIEYIEG